MTRSASPFRARRFNPLQVLRVVELRVKCPDPRKMFARSILRIQAVACVADGADRIDGGRARAGELKYVTADTILVFRKAGLERSRRSMTRLTFAGDGQLCMIRGSGMREGRIVWRRAT
jgi:hypothetical protein